MVRARRPDCRSRRSARRVSRARTALPLDPLGRIVTARVGALDDDRSVSREGTITRLAYSCMLMVGINSGWIGPFLPEISRTVHLPIERVGLIVSAAAAGSLISVLVAGEINQQLSAQKILIGAMALFTAGLAGLAASPGLTGLLCAGFLIGLANGGIDIGANALIVELNRGRGSPRPADRERRVREPRAVLVGVRRRRAGMCRDRISFRRNYGARSSNG